MPPQRGLQMGAMSFSSLQFLSAHPVPLHMATPPVQAPTTAAITAPIHPVQLAKFLFLKHHSDHDAGSSKTLEVSLLTVQESPTPVCHSRSSTTWLRPRPRLLFYKPRTLQLNLILCQFPTHYPLRSWGLARGTVVAWNTLPAHHPLLTSYPLFRVVLKRQRPPCRSMPRGGCSEPRQHLVPPLGYLIRLGLSSQSITEHLFIVLRGCKQLGQRPLCLSTTQ